MPGHASTWTVRPNILSAKFMLCIGWDQFSLVYCELLKPSETITSIAHGLAHHHFRSYEEVRTWIDSWVPSKDASFFRDGIRQLTERWKKQWLATDSTLNHK